METWALLPSYCQNPGVRHSQVSATMEEASREDLGCRERVRDGISPLTFVAEGSKKRNQSLFRYCRFYGTIAGF